jgi:hypothetical protein
MEIRMRELQLRLCGDLGKASCFFNGGAYFRFELFCPGSRISKNGLLLQSVCALCATDLGATIVGEYGLAAAVQAGASYSL